MFVHLLVTAILPTSFALFNYNQQATIDYSNDAYGLSNAQHPSGKQANSRRAKAKNVHRNNAYQPKHVAKDIYQRPKQVDAYAPPTYYSREPKQASAYGPRRVAKHGPKRINAYEPKHVAKSKESYRPRNGKGKNARNNVYEPKKPRKHAKNNNYEPANPDSEPVDDDSYEPIEEPVNGYEDPYGGMNSSDETETTTTCSTTTTTTCTLTTTESIYIEPTEATPVYETVETTQVAPVYGTIETTQSAPVYETTTVPLYEPASTTTTTTTSTTIETVYVVPTSTDVSEPTAHAKNPYLPPLYKRSQQSGGFNPLPAITTVVMALMMLLV